VQLNHGHRIGSDTPVATDTKVDGQFSIAFGLMLEVQQN
jgi:hypothetical protein